MVSAIGFLIRVAFGIFWALVYSWLLRNVAWPWIKSIWKHRPTITFASA